MSAGGQKDPSPPHVSPHHWGTHAALAACRRLLGDALHPLPHAAAGLRHGGGAGRRAAHGAPPDQAAAVSHGLHGWDLPPLHPAVLPQRHRAHAAGKAAGPCSWPFVFPSRFSGPAGRMQPQLFPAGSCHAAPPPSSRPSTEPSLAWAPSPPAVPAGRCPIAALLGRALAVRCRAGSLCGTRCSSPVPSAQWARDEFEGLFQLPAESVNRFLE